MRQTRFGMLLLDYLFQSFFTIQSMLLLDIALRSQQGRSLLSLELLQLSTLHKSLGWLNTLLLLISFLLIWRSNLRHNLLLLNHFLSLSSLTHVKATSIGLDLLITSRSCIILKLIVVKTVTHRRQLLSYFILNCYNCCCCLGGGYLLLYLLCRRSS